MLNTMTSTSNEMQLRESLVRLMYNVAAQLAPDSSLFPVLWSAPWFNPGNPLAKMRAPRPPGPFGFILCVRAADAANSTCVYNKV